VGVSFTMTSVLTQNVFFSSSVFIFFPVWIYSLFIVGTLLHFASEHDLHRHLVNC
jgi:hypothetical protein